MNKDALAILSQKGGDARSASVGTKSKFVQEGESIESMLMLNSLCFFVKKRHLLEFGYQ